MAQYNEQGKEGDCACTSPASKRAVGMLRTEYSLTSALNLFSSKQTICTLQDASFLALFILSLKHFYTDPQ